MKCLVCNINDAIKDPQLGYLACQSCRARQAGFTKPSYPIEFTSQNIKDERKKYFKSTIQPWRDGQPSLEYQKAYPEQAGKMFKKYKKSQIKEVWKDISPVGGIERTK